MRSAALPRFGSSSKRAGSLLSAVNDVLHVQELGWLFFLSALAMPFATNSEPLLLVMLAVQFICVLRWCATASERFLMCFMLAFAYSGITILSVRLYDWVVIVGLAYFFLVERYRINLSVLVKGLVGLFAVLLLLAASYSPGSLTQFMRFALSLACCIVFASTGINKSEISRCLMVPIVISLYCAIVMLARYGFAANISGLLVSTNFFIYDDEVRGAGFFSDPNKFMSFLLIMLFLADWAKGARGLHIELLPIFAGLLLTGSRTALISIVLYFAYKLFCLLTKNGLQAFVLLAAAGFLTFASILLASGGDLSGMVGRIWNGAAELLGRDRTLAINSSLSQDSRILIWQYTLGFISEKPFLGWGLDAYQTLLPYPTHNTFLNLLLSGGILYLVVFILNTYPVATKGDLFLFLALVFVPVFLLDLLDYRLLFCLVGLLQNPSGEYERKTLGKEASQ